jgi:hypothetical protein
MFLALIVSPLNAQPNEMRAKPEFRQPARVKEYMNEYIMGMAWPILVKWWILL